MNKRKTLRMTSILLALMMFFGMVSVLLVPAGTAAADANELIGLDLSGAVQVDQGAPASKLDSKNVLVKQYDNIAPLMWSKSELDALYTDKTFVYDSIKLTLLDPNGTAVVTEQPIELKDGVYYYNVQNINATGRVTGLYTAVLVRYTTNTAGQEAREKVEVRAGAFWLCEVADSTASTGDYDPTKNIIADAVTTSGKTTISVNGVSAADPKTANYNGPEAKINVEALIQAVPDTSATTFYKHRWIDPYYKSINTSYDERFAGNAVPTTAGKHDFVIPENPVHGRELRYGTMVIKDTNTSAGYCKFIPAIEPASVTNTKFKPGDENLVIIDAKAPTIDASAFKLSFGGQGLAATYYTQPMAFSDVDGYTVFKQMPTLTAGTNLDGRIRVLQTKKNAATDANSGVSQTASPALNINAELKLWQLGKGTAAILAGQTPSAANLTFVSDNIALIEVNTFATAQLVDGMKNCKLVLSVKDKVGNEATLETGLLEVAQLYNPINRVDAVINEYRMQVGDTVEIADLAEQIRAVAIGLDASKAPSYPTAWTIKSATAGATLDEYFDIEYDDDNETIVRMTAKKAGTTNISAFLTPVKIHQQMTNVSQPIHTYNTTSDPIPFYETNMNPFSNNLYFAISEKDEYPVTSVAVTPKTKEMAVGEKFTPTATVSPANATNKKVEWVSGDTNIATVDKDTGEITAVADGECFVYARSAERTGIQDDIKIYVGKTIVDPPTPVDPPVGWQDENNNRYYYVDGQKVVGWRKIEGSWYFFDYSTAAMRANGWLKEGGKWYYLNSNGTMKSAEWFKDNNGKWYWLKANGAMAAGWEKINGTWYYFNASGAMQTGWVNVRGIWYYMKSSGAMAEGWLQDGGSWYYLTPGGGAMVTGRVTINGRASNFATSGRWLGYV